MRYLLPAALVCASVSSPIYADANLERGFDGALRGCEEWLLNPASWADGTGLFVEAVGLGAQMGLVDRVEEVNFPPPQLRRANHYWRINSSPDAGYVLVVSDQLPMCHITGGGVDLQPSVQSVLSSTDFENRWQSETSTVKDGIATTVFRNREEPALTITISRADKSGERLDRVQVLATAIFEIAS
ncbi:hypothetical protein [Qipengyuania soli]|uniref:Uncharacterized protein n=1 Tax=Qipengyuania soli TaxID=2782568 RepID=A0A7S8F3X6_9SPHN|nr:hypothetical protein [Qipengyuania soli]QPC98759.1 hypothetical protein IRL76_13115 [Qipengyuania soli]